MGGWGGNGGIRTHVIINKEIKKKKKAGRKTKQNKKNKGKTDINEVMENGDVILAREKAGRAAIGQSSFSGFKRKRLSALGCCSSIQHVIH